MSAAALAFGKLQALAQPDALKEVFRRFNHTATKGNEADITSCAATATAVIKTLTDQTINADDFASFINPALATNIGKGGMFKRTLTKNVVKVLREPVVVMISLTFEKPQVVGGGGDHHFCAFSLDGGTVVVPMGWQKIYDLSQWFEENNQGRFSADVFGQLLGKIEDGHSDAVVGLCAFLGLTKAGMPIPAALRTEVTGFKPKVVRAVYYQLPQP